MFFSTNLKHLRELNELTQETFVNQLGLFKRPTLWNYEAGKSEPNISTGLAIARFFNIQVEQLLHEDLTKYTKSTLPKKGPQILVATVDAANNSSTVLIAGKARAGYFDNFSNPDYLAEQPTLEVPKNLMRGLNHEIRGFEVEGDSMLGFPPKSYVLGSRVMAEDLESLKPGTVCVVVARTEGVVLKKVYFDDEQISLVSTNTQYPAYKIHMADVAEVWQFRCFISSELPGA